MFFNIQKKPTIKWQPGGTLPETQYGMYSERDEQANVRNKAKAQQAAQCLTDDLRESNREYLKSKKP